ncbi:MAG TPA: Flp family type IVb pilin [Candidatus Binataceae bacterium]
MNLLKLLLDSRWRWSRGQTMTEYALILAAIAVIALAAYTAMGTTVSAMVGTVNSDL